VKLSEDECRKYNFSGIGAACEVSHKLKGSLKVQLIIASHLRQPSEARGADRQPIQSREGPHDLKGCGYLLVLASGFEMQRVNSGGLSRIVSNKWSQLPHLVIPGLKSQTRSLHSQRLIQSDGSVNGLGAHVKVTSLSVVCDTQRCSLHGTIRV
jgi:hypothetical protein